MRAGARVVSVLVVLLSLVLVGSPDVLGSSRNHAVQHSPAFVMPSRNIACLYNSKAIRCDIFSGIKPEPTKACKFYWKGVLLHGTGTPSFLCIIDTIYEPSAPVLKFGSTWSRGPIFCRSTTRGLRCQNGSGHGFFLSREHARRW